MRFEETKERECKLWEIQKRHVDVMRDVVIFGYECSDMLEG
jgi:hypothetical protein